MTDTIDDKVANLDERSAFEYAKNSLDLNSLLVVILTRAFLEMVVSVVQRPQSKLDSWVVL